VQNRKPLTYVSYAASLMLARAALQEMAGVS
jgi:hypothetical protein